MAGEVKRNTRTKKSASAEKAYLNDDGYPFHCTSCGKGFMRQKIISMCLHLRIMQEIMVICLFVSVA